MSVDIRMTCSISVLLFGSKCRLRLVIKRIESDCPGPRRNGPAVHYFALDARETDSIVGDAP